MAMKKGNSYIQVTLTPFHVRKLKMICARTGLTKSGVIQRLVEKYELGGISDQELQKEQQK